MNVGVGLGDAGEHLVEVLHREAVEADVPDPGFQVAPDVDLVPGFSALAECLLSGELHVEPLGDRHVLSQRLPVAKRRFVSS
ncbi:hypothetical protein SCWH03_29810 [Streptomyces pacificus]|uniref:Uncharacterized protein n=1 Tax=Streptomyces pacificus TaxID=2705029 RepID=A0A6A0AVS4_9ACTN|nr:hypothetical protein SCWH03_29810 [Streptomyces pacificus]